MIISVCRNTRYGHSRNPSINWPESGEAGPTIEAVQVSQGTAESLDRAHHELSHVLS